MNVRLDNCYIENNHDGHAAIEIDDSHEVRANPTVSVFVLFFIFNWSFNATAPLLEPVSPFYLVLGVYLLVPNKVSATPQPQLWRAGNTFHAFVGTSLRILALPLWKCFVHHNFVWVFFFFGLVCFFFFLNCVQLTWKLCNCTGTREHYSHKQKYF